MCVCMCVYVYLCGVCMCICVCVVCVCVSVCVVCDQVQQEPSTPTLNVQTEVRKKSVNHRLKVYVGLSEMYFVRRDTETDFCMVLFIFSQIFSHSL